MVPVFKVALTLFLVAELQMSPTSQLFPYSTGNSYVISTFSPTSYPGLFQTGYEVIFGPTGEPYILPARLLAFA